MNGHSIQIWSPTSATVDAVVMCDCGWEEDAPTAGIASDLGDQHLRDVA